MKRIINIGLLILISGLAVLFFVLNPEEFKLFPRCIFNSITGYYCPGCGSQRAIHDLLHLNLSGVVNHNILFIPAFLLILYHYLSPLLNKTFGWKIPNIFYYKSTPWIIFGVVILFWIARNIQIYPFTILAPN